MGGRGCGVGSLLAQWVSAAWESLLVLPWVPWEGQGALSLVLASSRAKWDRSL